MKNILTLEAFAEWVEKQPAEKTFDYFDPKNCAFCQYLKGLGFKRAQVGGHDYSLTGRFEDDRLLPEGIAPSVLCGSTNTFGALAARLRAANLMSLHDKTIAMVKEAVEGE